MRVPYVLHLDPEALAHGHLVGEIQEVETGRVGAVRGGGDVVAFCCGSGSDGQPMPERPTTSQ